MMNGKIVQLDIYEDITMQSKIPNKILSILSFFSLDSMHRAMFPFLKITTKFVAITKSNIKTGRIYRNFIMTFWNCFFMSLNLALLFIAKLLF